MGREHGIAIAGRLLSIGQCIEKLRHYPLRTLCRYDLPGAGEANTLTREEIVRTRAVSSRISDIEVDWFLAKAKRAPWPSPEADDLRQADPCVPDGPYSELVNLYNHFHAGAPRGIGMAKISKVLHIKRPAAIPILDQRITSVYDDAAAQSAGRYPHLGHRRAYWAAIRDDLVANTESGAVEALRGEILDKLGAQGGLISITDLRLLDMLTWG